MFLVEPRALYAVMMSWQNRRRMWSWISGGSEFQVAIDAGVGWSYDDQAQELEQLRNSAPGQQQCEEDATFKNLTDFGGAKSKVKTQKGVRPPGKARCPKYLALSRP